MKIIGIDSGYSNSGICIIDAATESGKAFTVSSKYENQVAMLEHVGRCRDMHSKLRNIINKEIKRGDDIVIAAEFPTGGSKSGAAGAAMAMAVGVVSSLFNLGVNYRYAATPNDVKSFVRHNSYKVMGWQIPKDMKKIEKKLVKAFAGAVTSHRGGLRLLDGSDHAADAMIVALLTASSLGLFEELLNVPSGIKLYVC